jgi:hypothetical protein
MRHKSIKLIDLLISNSWLNIKTILLQLYPEEKNDILQYEKVYNELILLKPVEIDASILVKHYRNEEYEVSGYYNDKQKIITDISESLGLMEFMLWEKWLGMHIDKTTLQNFSELEIISHCLWEMTYVSFSQNKNQKEQKIIIDVFDEIKNKN